VSLVRKSTLQSQATIQAENEARDILEDTPHDVVSELVERFNVEGTDNSSLLRDDRSLSFYNLELEAGRRRKLVATDGTERPAAAPRQEDMRAVYLQNAQGSFQSANEESIASWGVTERGAPGPEGEVKSLHTEVMESEQKQEVEERHLEGSTPSSQKMEPEQPPAPSLFKKLGPVAGKQSKSK